MFSLVWISLLVCYKRLALSVIVYKYTCNLFFTINEIITTFLYSLYLLHQTLTTSFFFFLHQNHNFEIAFILRNHSCANNWNLNLGFIIQGNMKVIVRGEFSGKHEWSLKIHRFLASQSWLTMVVLEQIYWFLMGRIGRGRVHWWSWYLEHKMFLNWWRMDMKILLHMLQMCRELLSRNKRGNIAMLCSTFNKT